MVRAFPELAMARLRFIPTAAEHTSMPTRQAKSAPRKRPAGRAPDGPSIWSRLLTHRRVLADVAAVGGVILGGETRRREPGLHR